MSTTAPAACRFCSKPLYNLLGEWRHICSNTRRCDNGVSKATPERPKYVNVVPRPRPKYSQRRYGQ